MTDGSSQFFRGFTLYETFSCSMHSIEVVSDNFAVTDTFECRKLIIQKRRQVRVFSKIQLGIGRAACGERGLW